MKLATTLRLLAALAALSVAPAVAESSSAPASDLSSSAQSTVPDELQGMLGDWLLEREDPSQPACPMTLSDQQTTSGWAVLFPETCDAAYPVGKVAQWNVDTSDGSVLLSDTQGHAVLHLVEDEDGLFDNADGQGAKFYMVPPDDANGNGGEDDADP